MHAMLKSWEECLGTRLHLLHDFQVLKGRMLFLGRCSLLDKHPCMYCISSSQCSSFQYSINGYICKCPKLPVMLKLLLSRQSIYTLRPYSVPQIPQFLDPTESIMQ